MEQSVRVVDQSVYIARNGELQRLDIPKTGFGEVKITWQDKKIVLIRETTTSK